MLLPAAFQTNTADFATKHIRSTQVICQCSSATNTRTTDWSTARNTWVQIPREFLVPATNYTVT